MKTSNKFFAELFGTFVLVFGGCGTALFGHVGFLGVAIAFGLTVIAMAYGIGHISGAHLNPAVSFGVFVNGRMSFKEMLCYWAAQFIGGIIAGACLMLVAGVVAAPDLTGALGSNGVANAGGVGGAFLVETIATFLFVLVVLGTTDSKIGAGNFAGLAIGLTLILVHLVCINLTGTSVNPARSIGPAIFAGGQALADVWVFICAPLVGAALSALCWKYFETK
jgi:aquaporin Z